MKVRVQEQLGGRPCSLRIKAGQGQNVSALMLDPSAMIKYSCCYCNCACAYGRGRGYLLAVTSQHMFPGQLRPHARTRQPLSLHPTSANSPADPS